LFLGPNLVNVGMQDLSHGGSIHGDRNQDMGRDMPVAICVGGPALDLISALMRLPEQAIDAWDKLGGFLGGPAKVVKCETNDLTVPAFPYTFADTEFVQGDGRPK
jgi:UbiD family decarboxylase